VITTLVGEVDGNGITPSLEGVSAAEEKVRGPKVLDKSEEEFRGFIAFATEILGHQKTFTGEAFEKWRARRRKYSVEDICQAFYNLRNEPDQWKLTNNGFRPLT
jgi:hypothetical protein